MDVLDMEKKRREQTEQKDKTKPKGTSRRGFASMDEKTRREIARRGGETVARERGSEFYSEIGRIGGERVARERGSEFYAEIGREGGRSRRVSKQHPIEESSSQVEQAEDVEREVTVNNERAVNH